jgi:hypothetical protein
MVFTIMCCRALPWSVQLVLIFCHQVAVSRRVLLVSVLVLFIHLLVQILLLPRHYFFQYETWVNLMCILLSVAIAVGGETGDYMMPFFKDQEPTERTWVLHVMSFAVLLAWTELMLLMGRFPTCGYYALMFYHVLQNVIKVQYCYMNKIISHCHVTNISA